MKHIAFGRSLTSLSGLLPISRRRVTYLDSNAVSDLARLRPPASTIDGIEQVRRNLCSFASLRTIGLGQWVFSELSDLENGDRHPDFLADMAFLEQLQFIQVFRAPGEMQRLEVEAFIRRLEMNPALATTLPATTNDVALWAAEREHAAEMRNEYLAWEDRAAQRIAAEYPNGEDRAERLAANWNANRHGLVARWVRGQMREQRDSLGLPTDESRWPPPEKVPTFWCGWAYRITRDVTRATSPVIKKRKGSEKKGSHAVDWGHYMGAAHADEFVTSDEGFLEIARAAPGPKPEILSLEEWVGRLRRE